MDFHGLIAAGGVASRLGALPCSKEIFPLANHFNYGRIMVVCETLINYYKQADIKNIHFIIRKGKWDIPQLLGDGSENDVNISYHMMNLPYGTPFTLDQTYPFIRDKNIAMGFPDIVMKPENAFAKLKEKLVSSSADVVLGIFPIEYYWKWDMVEFEHEKIKEIIIKGKRADLKYGWSNAVWTPAFTEFMHLFLKDLLKKNENGRRTLSDGTERELYVGDVFIEAMKAGMTVEYVMFENGFTNDIGTHEEMADYLMKSMGKKAP
jgi:glucose-1-phosphate thymidylyltransferase